MGILTCNWLVNLLYLAIWVQFFGYYHYTEVVSLFSVWKCCLRLSEGKRTQQILFCVRIGKCVCSLVGKSTGNSERQDLKDRAWLWCRGPIDQATNFEFYTVVGETAKVLKQECEMFTMQTPSRNVMRQWVVLKDLLLRVKKPEVQPSTAAPLHVAAKLLCYVARWPRVYSGLVSGIWEAGNYFDSEDPTERRE